MKPTEYEELVQTILNELISANLANCKISGGSTNRIIGASGFAHQIDVSLNHPSQLLIVECKYWSKPIKVEAVLVLAARFIDIRAKEHNTEVFASIVSQFKPTKGATIIAKYFDINLDIVKSTSEYVLQVFNYGFVGKSSKICFKDKFSIV